MCSPPHTPTADLLQLQVISEGAYGQHENAENQSRPSGTCLSVAGMLHANLDV
jgi:hypothetical protein